MYPSAHCGNFSSILRRKQDRKGLPVVIREQDMHEPASHRVSRGPKPLLVLPGQP